MTWLQKILIILTLSFSSAGFAAVENNFDFTSPVQAERFHQLIAQLRCLVCQNQSLAESNAPLALDLKREVYVKINAGLSDAAIKQDLVTRYGEYILFKPGVSSNTFILWLGPFLFLCGATLIMYISIKRQTKNSMHKDNSDFFQENFE